MGQKTHLPLLLPFSLLHQKPKMHFVGIHFGRGEPNKQNGISNLPNSPMYINVIKALTSYFYKILITKKRGRLLDTSLLVIEGVLDS